MSSDKLPQIKTLQSSDNKKSLLTPKMASFICPGLGQILEGRLIVGIVQMLIFFVPFILLLLLVAKLFFFLINRIFAQIGVGSESYPESLSAPWLQLIIYLAIMILVYAWSIFDAGKPAPSQN